MLSPTHSSTAHTTAITPAIPERSADAWHLARKDLPGSRESVVRTPRGEILQIEVSSWVQVPYLFQKLQESSVKLVFPSGGTSPTAEQEAIKAFLQAGHSMSIPALFGSLANQLDKSPGFVPGALPPPGAITCGADWIAAHRLSEVMGKQLSITEIVRPPLAEDPASAEFASSDISALTSGRPVVVEVPDGAELVRVAASLREALVKLPDHIAISRRTTVWLPDKDVQHAWTHEMPLPEFLKDSGISPASDERVTGSETSIDTSLTTLPDDGTRSSNEGTSSKKENRLMISDSVDNLPQDIRKEVSDEEVLEWLTPDSGLSDLIQPPLDYAALDEIIFKEMEADEEAIEPQDVQGFPDSNSDTPRQSEKMESATPESASGMFAESGEPTGATEGESASSPGSPTHIVGGNDEQEQPVAEQISPDNGIVSPDVAEGQSTDASDGGGMVLDSSVSILTGSLDSMVTMADAQIHTPLQNLGNEVTRQHLSAISRQLSAHPNVNNNEGLVKYLQEVYTCRLLPDVSSPIADYTETLLITETDLQPIAVTPGSAARILKECRDRSLEDSARLLFEAHEHLLDKFFEDPQAGSSLQESYLVTLPDKGDAIFVSDLEGDVTKLALLIDQYRLIERWQNGESIFLCVLGDMVDRSDTGSLLVEFLLDLKVRQGFSRQIIIVPGNHELTVCQNFTDLEFWRAEKPFISDLFGREYLKGTDSESDTEVLTRLQELCPKSALPSVGQLTDIDEESFKARWGLYTLFHSIFHAMPRCILSENGLFAAHAGIPMYGPLAELFQPTLPADLDQRRYRQALAGEIFDDRSAGASLNALTWYDLETTLGSDGEFIPLNDQRRSHFAGRHVFTPADFARFCAGTGSSLMIRGHQSNGPEGSTKPEFLEKVYRDKSDRPIAPWITERIATVGSHVKWSALLDLSISQPTSKDVEWIGSYRWGQEKCKRLANGRRSAPDPAERYFLALPALSGDRQTSLPTSGVERMDDDAESLDEGVPHCTEDQPESKDVQTKSPSDAE